MEGEGPARETGGACLTALPCQCRPLAHPSDTIHQTLIRFFWIQSRRRALTRTGNSAPFWMMGLIVRAPDIRRHCRQEGSDTVTDCQ